MTPKIIFIGGTRASGKSTLANAVIEGLNRQRRGRVVQVEAGENLRRYSQETFGKDVDSRQTHKDERVPLTIINNDAGKFDASQRKLASIVRGHL